MNAYGLTERFTALAAAYEGLIPARVLSQEKGLYRIVSERGEKHGEISGKLRYQADAASAYPAVGDFVMVDWNQTGGNAVIQQILPRKSCFIRKAAGNAQQEQVVAANIDTVFLCMSLNHDFNLRRLERYLSIAWDSGAIPVIVLTKADLCGDLEARLAEVTAAAPGVDLLVTNALADNGYEQLLPYLTPGRTVALIGSSGVGKSTLINRLLGESRLRTNGLRDDDKGRHTTTRRELILLPGGAIVIDTPGMRELGMWEAAEGIDRTFADIERLAAACRFSDCTHTGEPGCAVREAIARGALDESRLRSYQKLTAENRYVEDAAGYLAEKKQKFKNIAKINKNLHKR